jgi:hypothetical protein
MTNELIICKDANGHSHLTRQKPITPLTAKYLHRLLELKYYKKEQKQWN